jgi:MoaA/NifB/PqqE/SkfB family radical SAM enzyme
MAYKTCDDLENSLYLGPDQFRACCQRFFYESKIRGDAPLMNLDENSLPTPKQILKARQNLYNKIQNDKAESCKGCRYIEEVDNPPQITNNIKHLSIEHHSVCNLRCAYCSEIYYGGKKPHYKIDEFIKSLSKENCLNNCKQIVWGGGEPTADKSFQKTLENIDHYSSPDLYHRVFTNSVSYRKVVEEFLKKRLIKIITSVDAGTEETFTKVRGRNRMKNVFENLHKYSRYKPSDIAIKYIINNENNSEYELKEFVKKCVKYDLTGCCFQISINYKYEKLSLSQLNSVGFLMGSLMKENIKKVYVDDHIMARFAGLNSNEKIKLEDFLKIHGFENILIDPKKYDSIILFGAGQIAKELVTKTNFFKNICSFDIIDTSSKKIGTKFLGKKIHGMDLLENDNRNLIISAVQSFDDIYSLILDKKGNSQNILCGLVV